MSVVQKFIHGRMNSGPDLVNCAVRRKRSAKPRKANLKNTTLMAPQFTLVTATEGSGLIHEIRPNKEETTITPSTKNCKPTRVKAAQFHLQRTRYRIRSDHPEHSSDKQAGLPHGKPCDRARHGVDIRKSKLVVSWRTQELIPRHHLL